MALIERVMSGFRVSAILLAAGESRRMGDSNKLELPIGGVPLLRHTVQTLLATSLQEIIVVLGHQSDRMRLLLDGLAVTIVQNEAYRDGQMTSVYAGLKALQRPCDGVMICLTDQPLLTKLDINRLITAFMNRRRGSVLVPTHQGKRGNPIIFAYQHRASILAGDRNLGCKRLIEHNPELVVTSEMDNNHTVVDMDTMEDYNRLSNIFNQQLDRRNYI